MVYLYFLRVIEEFTYFPFYLSRPIHVIWHARVGVFYSLKTLTTKIPNTRKLHYSHVSLLFLFDFITIHLYYSSLTFCHWNLNGLTAHDSIKIFLFQAYVTQHNYDIICLSETFLNSSIDSSDIRILIDGYNLIRSDHPSDSKRRWNLYLLWRAYSSN